MKYLSVCSGIEAATVAWHPLGWTPVAFSEIEKFPSQVLAHHYPDVPNLGDMTKFKEWNLESNVDVFVGGTPCQSFSVAGLRKGLDDPRGNLMLTYLAIADKYRPRWLVWENVFGVLSSNGGKDFATFLGGLGELGYGFAYRVLDAQYFGVAQRRRRVFVVGYLGDWRPPAAVLFERHSLSGHPAPSRAKGKRVASYVESSFGNYRTDEVGGTTKASGEVLGGGSETFIAQPVVNKTKIDIYENHATDSRIKPVDVCPTVTSRWGTGGNNVPLAHSQPIPYDLHQVTSPVNSQNRKSGDPCHTLAKENAHNAGIVQAIPIDSMNHLGRKGDHSFGDFVEGAPSYTLTKGHSHAVAQPMVLMDQGGSVMNVNIDGTVGTLRREMHGHEPVVMQPVGVDSYNLCETGDVTQTLKSPQGGVIESIGAVRVNMAVRRLTVKECERLQGFPDNYTDIQHKGKPTPDGPRYKALGNSMAVPVMAWIGKRIQMVENL